MGQHINIEIKARCADLALVKTRLEALEARFVGTDHQIDTYFESPNGRLKLRQGTIENSLIFYNRQQQAAPKQSDVHLYHPSDTESLKAVLQHALSIKVVVDKQRSIYFIGNVKFHLDEVTDLGQFVEIEAIDKDGTIGLEELHRQCKHYMKVLGIMPTDLIEESYSDLLFSI